MAGEPQQKRDDVTARAFARWQTVWGRFWLRLDAGPDTHFITVDPASGGDHHSSVGWAADVAGSAALSVTRFFFVGVRARGSYLLDTGGAAGAEGSRWGGEAMGFLGARLW